MPRKKETITLSIPTGTKEQLEAIALRLGIKWGKSPSVSGLLVAIAQQTIEVGEPFTLNSVQVQSLDKAVKFLNDSGEVEAAQIVLGLLLDRANLEAPMRQQLLEKVSQTNEAWRLRLNQLKADRQPFRLFYQSGKDKVSEFTARSANIRLYDKRLYLEIWCDDPDSKEIPELAHNRCLRLDKIVNLLPASETWRENIDYLEVHLHFFKGLARNYEFKPDEDVANEMVGDVRHVVKRVSNLFWLFRDVRRYGKDCEIVSPQNVRDRFQQEIIDLGRVYNLEIRD
ncbi:YafY family protein [Tychonema sp. BBK16]|uniref:helix-turn-helix transcriptional regulator n=1 Tax=Tychonema sp. BBK16 TaxID=2699888 RepID=UPI001F3CA3B4|nr:WYL domain-containing protein [Tychonema sp. BBK16]MCF6374145.1 WYL domain-containing protein [Tychonema sp. BBK16]